MPFAPTILRLSGPRPEPQHPPEPPPAPAPARAIARQLAQLSQRLAPVTRIEAGLRPFEQRVLQALARRSAASLVALARRLACDPAQASRAIKRLTAQHLVTTAAAEDRRRRALALTEAGRDLAARLLFAAETRLEAALAPLPPPRRTRLAETLRDTLAALPATAAKAADDPEETSPVTFGLRMARVADLSLACHLAAKQAGDRAREADALAAAATYLASREPSRDCAWVATKTDGTLAALALFQASATPARHTLVYAETDAAADAATEQCEMFAAMVARRK